MCLTNFGNIGDPDAITVNADNEDNSDDIAALASAQDIPNPDGGMIVATAQGQDDGNDIIFDPNDDSTKTTTSTKNTTSTRSSTTTTRSSTRTSTTSTKRTSSTSSTESSTSTSTKSSATSTKTSELTTDNDSKSEMGVVSLESEDSDSQAENKGSSSQSSSGRSMSTAAKVGASVGGSIGGSAIICVFIFVFLSRRRRKLQKVPDNIVLEAEAPPSEARDLELGGANEEPLHSEENPDRRTSVERPVAFDRLTRNPQINHMELPPQYDDLPENRIAAVTNDKEKD
ncbi:hypothetical protein IW150_001828 [Coemansia sp. RSA 2607]|nr:hypothetical protein IW150_001828 [Coemansia sp. RSA 2607]